jgi:hypothetical protein
MPSWDAADKWRHTSVHPIVFLLWNVNVLDWKARFWARFVTDLKEQEKLQTKSITSVLGAHRYIPLSPLTICLLLPVISATTLDPPSFSTSSTRGFNSSSAPSFSCFSRILVLLKIQLQKLYEKYEKLKGKCKCQSKALHFSRVLDAQQK